MASYEKDDLCAKAALPRHAPSPQVPVLVTLKATRNKGSEFPICPVPSASEYEMGAGQAT